MERCTKDNCEYHATHDSPKILCDWHWSLWWSIGAHDPKQEDMIEYAKYICFTIQSEHGIKGNQKIIAYSDIDFTKFISGEE